MEFHSLSALAGGEEFVRVSTVLGALAGMESAAEAENALTQLNGYADSIMGNSNDFNDAMGALEVLGAVLRMPATRLATPRTQARSFAAMERMRGIVVAGTALQVSDAQRPNVFLVSTFDHVVPGPLSILNLKPSLPAQSTIASQNGPLHFIQNRIFLKSGSFANADLQIEVARVPSNQYSAPAGAPEPEGLPIEYWSSQSYNTGLKPPRIRGLEQADSNTVITQKSFASAAVKYVHVMEFVMEAFLGGSCGRILPSIIRGPMQITARR